MANWSCPASASPPVARSFSKLRMYSTAQRRVSTLLILFFLHLPLAGGDETEDEEQDEDEDISGELGNPP